MNSRHSIILVLLLLLIGAGCFLAGRKTARRGGESTIVVRVDTLVIRDTIVSYKPKYITKRVVDTAYVPVTDTIRKQDTLFLALPREQVTWEDSLARVYASGIDPKVDSVMHYRTELVIDHIVPVKVQSRWGIGVQGGYGLSKDGLTPYVGVGVSYNLLAW